ncbi:hypothetical protein PINS_up004860 [Pythium insidiosum]|nr:hypothetical protein PINS_up004860 [Pythium insidiosum]
MATTGERTPILPVTGDQPSTRRRRVAILGGAVVLLTALLVIGYSAGSHLWSSKEATTTGAGHPVAAPASAPSRVAPQLKSAPIPKTLGATHAPVAPASTPAPESTPAQRQPQRQRQRRSSAPCRSPWVPTAAATCSRTASSASSRSTSTSSRRAAGGTYEQRYFVCGRPFFNPTNGSIFFYTGNEADVLLYLNNTGLMWENAEEFNALLVFAEHRYFGASKPFGDAMGEHLEFLSSTQALADFAVLIEALKAELQADVPVIGFGGSYGGMLSAWLRLKYPHVVDGVIAASAPVLHFENDPEHAVDPTAFLRTVVFDMTPAAGASANCVPNVRKASATLTRLAQTLEGRVLIAEALHLCDAETIMTEDDIQALAVSTIGAFGTLAMGNFPYPSSYMTEGAAELPAYPVRAACEFLAPDFGDDDRALLDALRQSAGVLYNATGQETCFFPTQDDEDAGAGVTRQNATE